MILSKILVMKPHLFSNQISVISVDKDLPLNCLIKQRVFVCQKFSGPMHILWFNFTTLFGKKNYVGFFPLGVELIFVTSKHVF